MSKITITVYDGVMHRTGVVPHSPDKPPVRCQFCYKDCNPYSYYTWQTYERAIYHQKPPSICNACCELVEHWTEILAPLIPNNEWRRHEIIPRPCELIQEIQRDQRLQAEAAEREAQEDAQD